MALTHSIFSGYQHLILCRRISIVFFCLSSWSIFFLNLLAGSLPEVEAESSVLVGRLVSDGAVDVDHVEVDADLVGPGEDGSAHGHVVHAAQAPAAIPI